jgi:hypothetical protein
MQVTAAPLSNSHEKVLFPVLTAYLGLILSQLKGLIISNSLLQVAIEIVYKLRIICGMMLGVSMRGVIRLFLVKNWLLSLFISVLLFTVVIAFHIPSRHVLVCLYTAYFVGFFSSILLSMDLYFTVKKQYLPFRFVLFPAPELKQLLHGGGP